MARRCPDCQIDLDRFAERGSDKHRCIKGKPVGQRAPTRLEAEQIAKGQLDASILLPKTSATTQPVGRLAPRGIHQPPISGFQENHQGQARQPTNTDLLEAITKLTLAFEKLQATLDSQDRPRTDA